MMSTVPPPAAPAFVDARSRLVQHQCGLLPMQRCNHGWNGCRSVRSAVRCRRHPAFGSGPAPPPAFDAGNALHSRPLFDSVLTSVRSAPRRAPWNVVRSVPRPADAVRRVPCEPTGRGVLPTFFSRKPMTSLRAAGAHKAAATRPHRPSNGVTVQSPSGSKVPPPRPR
jgi:hypothetical protein